MIVKPPYDRVLGQATSPAPAYPSRTKDGWLTQSSLADGHFEQRAFADTILTKLGVAIYCVQSRGGEPKYFTVLDDARRAFAYAHLVAKIEHIGARCAGAARAVTCK